MKQTNRRDPRNRIDFLMMLMFLMHLKIHTTFCKKQISSLMYLNESWTTVITEVAFYLFLTLVVCSLTFSFLVFI